MERNMDISHDVEEYHDRYYNNDNGFDQHDLDVMEYELCAEIMGVKVAPVIIC